MPKYIERGEPEVAAETSLLITKSDLPISYHVESMDIPKTDSKYFSPIED